MVRETRHLWVGNLPDNIREDRIREHFKRFMPRPTRRDASFKLSSIPPIACSLRYDDDTSANRRYGRVQNVKLLGRMENATVGANGSTTTGVCATVAFMDIKSASKAHNVEHVLDERTLTTEYYEPAAIPSAAGAPSAGSSPAGSGYSGSSSSVNSTPAPVAASRYHLSGEESAGNACAMAASAAAPATWRGTNDSATEYCRRGNTPASYTRYQRNNSNAPYATPPSNIESRSTPHHRWYASGERASAGAGAGAGGTTGGESTPSTPGGAGEVRRRHSGSGSSRSDSSSPEPSDTSRASTPAAPPPLAHHSNHRTPPGHPHQRASTANGRPLAICVRNLPARSTDSSLKDGLYHEYKKHGKVVWVKVVGQSADRYAVVRFKKPSDVDKALEVSQDKLFFGCKISVAPHQNCDEDCETAKPYETDIDEYHPKATRTLFIGNLEKDVTQQQLRDKFKHFGRIIEIDIKKGSGGGAGYAFCQYASISSVVEAIRAMDGEYVGGSRVKLGFGKPVATTCVWVDGLTEHTEKQVLGAVSRCGAATSVCVDRAAGAALVHFEQAAAAGAAVRELRRVAAHASAAEPDHPRLCVDYASRECQEAFYEQLEKHGGTSSLTGAERLPADSRYPPASRLDPLRYDGSGARARAPSFGRGSSRTRYSAHEHYDPADYAADRRYRVYDDLGSSPQTDEAAYEDRLQSVVVSPHRTHRHRRDSSPEERKHSKERHRSVGGASRRSRSGSRGSRHATRRRHRRRRDGSGSRAGTPLRDEPDTLPVEPRRPPRDRPPLPMSLPLPKFAVQLLRQAPPAPRRVPAPAPAPDSPPRPPSASSSSAGSAPHSPSLEERIRSLDEKYERWSGSARAPADAPDRARLRHRLLEIDINEVKPSEVVRSLLAKRSVFDEDSERLEGAVRAPSPGGSPRPRGPPAVPRTLRYPFPSHAPHEHDADASERLERQDRPVDPRLARADRPERTAQPDCLLKLNEADYRTEPRPRPRTPSTDGGVPDLAEPKQIRSDRQDLDGESTKKDIGRRRSSCYGKNNDKNLNCIDAGDILEALCEKQNIDAVPSYESLDKPRDADRPAITEKLSYSEQVIKTSTDVLGNCLPTEYGDVTKPNLENEKPKSSWSQSEKQESIVPSETSSNESTLNAIQITCESNTKTEVSLKDSIKSKTVDECKPEETGNKLNTETEKLENSIPNHIDEEILSFHRNAPNHLNVLTGIDLILKAPESSIEIKHNENSKNIHSSHNHIESFQKDKFQKENVEFEKVNDKLKLVDTVCFNADKKEGENEKKQDETFKNEREKVKQIKDKIEKEKHDNEKNTNTKNKNIKNDKTEKEKKLKDDFNFHKSTIERNSKKLEKDQEKIDDKHRDTDKIKHADEKAGNHENHKKDRHEKDRSKHNIHLDHSNKFKKEEKYKHERSKRECDIKRDNKKDSDFVKSRKSSKDESARDLCRKDSTDSSASRTSHDSTKMRDSDSNDIREETKSKVTLCNDIVIKQEVDKDLIKNTCTDLSRVESLKPKTKIDKGEENSDQHFKIKIDCNLESGSSQKNKSESMEKQRHYSFDSSGLDTKRKERLNSCSSLPSNIGHKRRMSSQDSLDCLNDDTKKSRNDIKQPERRDSKDSRSTERHKTTKFNKGHFAKIIESKTKDDKKNQVKPPDDPYIQLNDKDNKETVFDKVKNIKKSPKDDNSESTCNTSVIQNDELQNNLDFLATLELRSSEEDERQKALRKEMKEKKRIQQLQQIQELQMQQDALQQAEINKLKEDKKNKMDDKKKDLAREKRMSTDRKSKDEKMEHNKRKNRKQAQSTDTSDSDEPKKHSIFDIVDDGPTYISMYDKVKARSCKNMQKQEEEKRQEKIKAKFSQLKQSRAKREEKKRSSWDEDSDSEHERQKSHKTSFESSSEDDHMVINSKKREKVHMSSVDYDIQKCNDYFSAHSNDEDSRNKLSRKNSRSRIMSDTSDDDVSKRNSSKSPSFIDRIKREIMSDSESNLSKSKDSDFLPKESCEDKIKRTSLLNLFGKSDSDDCKLKANFETENEYKVCYPKTISNDISSETESISSSRNDNEQRKKHKKKQKRHKCSYSDEEFKVENSNDIDGENKARYIEKNKRHGNRKDKRKDKIRESVDTDEVREDKIKIKKEKISPVHSFDGCPEISPNNIKKEGKMEDIFGPLSDDSDKETSSLQSNKLDYVSHNYEPILSSGNDKLTQSNEEIQQKDDLKRRKEKKRKEKRYFVRDEENSLDVDAVSKAIEARLFADTPACETRIRVETIIDNLSKTNHGDGHFADHIQSDSILEKHAERLKRESREKERKKKKKKNKEDRQSRKEHHHFYHNDKDIILEKFDAFDCARDLQIVTNTMLLDIPLPNDDQVKDNIDKTSDSLLPSPSLPCLTEGTSLAQTNPSKEDIKIDPDVMIIDDKISNDYEKNKCIEVHDIPMPPPFENIVQNICDVPLPKDPVPILTAEPTITESIPIPSIEIDVSSEDSNENAVRSISNLEDDSEKQSEKVDAPTSSKVDKKLDEKPRAIISQEETEDAVAALLGESFGGKDDSFGNCYEETENNPTNQIEIECTTNENENIPEEDAEEMRQAVQNLNASEMEMKPDTPVSDNDLLLIDTDTEEAEDMPQDAIERLPINIIATNQSLTNSSKSISVPKTADVSSVSITKPKPTSGHSLNPESETNVKVNEKEIKIPIIKRDSIHHLSTIATSTGTPVITSWTLSSKAKTIESQIINIPASSTPVRDSNESRAKHVTANIVQIKSPQGQNLQIHSGPRPPTGTIRANTPYQVINQIARPPTSASQPPTIKIPEAHVPLQRAQAVGLSPRPHSPRAVSVVSAAGGVTVVRVQPPLSPHARPAVLLQPSPLHFTRLPVAPVLAPLSRAPVPAPDPHVPGVLRVEKVDPPVRPPAMLPVGAGSPMPDRRESPIRKVENHVPFGSPPVIHVAGVDRSVAPVVQNCTKPIVCSLQQPIAVSRAPSTNVIHAPQRLLTTAPMTSVIQLDPSRLPSSVLSMATIKHPTVLTKSQPSHVAAVTTSSISKVVMTPVLLKTPTPIRLSPKGILASSNTKCDSEQVQNIPPNTNVKTLYTEEKNTDKTPGQVDLNREILRTSSVAAEPVTKCETDFEELLKDTTNEIKVTNNPEKKLEINVGKSITIMTHSSERRKSIDAHKSDMTPKYDSNLGEEIKQDKLVNDITEIIDSKISTNIDVIQEANNPADSHRLKEGEIGVIVENNDNLVENVPSDKNNEIPKNCSNNEESNITEAKLPTKDSNEDVFDSLRLEKSEDKNLDENEFWSAKDVNIESVIKKVDSLCNESSDLNVEKEVTISNHDTDESNVTEPSIQNVSFDETELSKNVPHTEHTGENITSDEPMTEKPIGTSKRGGRSVRGKKVDRAPDRVQTRQISKPSRGTGASKRGRGRAKVDKKIKNLVTSHINNIPGDVYDFHEDSGDESASTKPENRPRLILTIKSPLSGQSNATPTSTLSITPKDAGKNLEKPTKDEKLEVFASPSMINTRKSRRLQEKDVQRSTVDDVIDDVIKSVVTQPRANKDPIKKRATRQANAKPPEKLQGADTRKSPRGTKRIRDRSLSDASVDSNDEAKREDTAKDAKVPRLTEPLVAVRTDAEPSLARPLGSDVAAGVMTAMPAPAPVPSQAVIPAAVPSSILAPPPTPAPAPQPMPIMKPPKKMISEKLAGAFDGAFAIGTATTTTTTTVAATERLLAPSPERFPEAKGAKGAESAELRRPLDGVPGAMAGAAEATDARGQSPALPHRPPSAHRATPILIRGGDGDMGVAVAGVGGVAGGVRGFRGAYAGPASLPRGAHHPQHSQHPPPSPHSPHAPHALAKQPPQVISSHHQLNTASRVTITSVPAVSPQGQMSLGDRGMYPHFSHQHYQVYQQHFRATQDQCRTSPYPRSLEPEGSEAPTPPLELRRPAGARVPRAVHSPAHSPAPHAHPAHSSHPAQASPHSAGHPAVHSAGHVTTGHPTGHPAGLPIGHPAGHPTIHAAAPAAPPPDRLIMYAVGCGRSPPPTYGGYRPASSLPPPAAPGPPHASQVPREADSLQMLLRRYPVMWQGLLALKNDSAAVQMHFVGGNPGVAADALSRNSDGTAASLLRIAQRMRLEQAQLDQVHRKMKMDVEHCMLLALPCGRDHMDVLQQSTNLTAGFITYLQRKQAAGIVNVAPTPGHQQSMYTVHIFPSCDFANENLTRIAPDLMHRVANIAHLLIVIATATT